MAKKKVYKSNQNTVNIYNNIVHSIITPNTAEVGNTYTGTLSAEYGYSIPEYVDVWNLSDSQQIESLYDTSWVLSDTLTNLGESQISLSFTSNDNTFNKIEIKNVSETETPVYVVNYYKNQDTFETVYSQSSGWLKFQYRCLSDISGQSSTETETIQFFINNGKIKASTSPVQVIQNTLTIQNIQNDICINGKVTQLNSIKLNEIQGWDSWYRDNEKSTIGTHYIQLKSSSIDYAESELSQKAYFDIFPITYNNLSGCSSYATNKNKTPQHFSVESKFTASDGYTFNGSTKENANVFINNVQYLLTDEDEWSVEEDYKTVTVRINNKPISGAVNFSTSAIDASVPLSAPSIVAIDNNSLVMSWNQVNTPVVSDEYEFKIGDSIIVNYTASKVEQTYNAVKITSAATSIDESTINIS